MSAIREVIRQALQRLLSPESGLWEAPKSNFQDAAPSQLDVSETLASDRVAVALRPTGNRTADMPPEKSQQNDRLHC